MNELERILSKYFSKDGTGITYSDFNQEEVDKLFRNMKPYERPDILSIYDNKIVAIEHFEFDSYKNTRKKGSDFKIQESFIERKMQNKINSELKTKSEIIVHDEIKNTSNLQQYYDNFKKVFLSHIDNIPEYREHIEQDFGKEKKYRVLVFCRRCISTWKLLYKKGKLKAKIIITIFKRNNRHFKRTQRNQRDDIWNICHE